MLCIVANFLSCKHDIQLQSIIELLITEIPVSWNFLLYSLIIKQMQKITVLRFYLTQVKTANIKTLNADEAAEKWK